MSSLELILLLLSRYCTKRLNHYSTLVFKAHSLERLDAELISSQYIYM